jgi:hypothetical protein
MALPLACHLLILGPRDVSIAEQDGCVFMALRYSYCHPYALPSEREERGAAIIGPVEVGRSQHYPLHKIQFTSQW